MKKIGLLITFVAFLTGNGWTQTIHITIVAPSARGQSVTLSTPNVFALEPIPLSESKLDSSGKATIQIAIIHTLFANLAIGRKRYQLLVSPGDQLQIQQADSPQETAVRFTGKGASAADYLLQSAILWQQYENQGGKHLMQLEPDLFSRRLDSAQNAYASLHHRFAQKASLDKTLLHLLEQRGKMQLLTYQLNYALAHADPNDTTNHTQLSLQKVVHQVPFDPKLLQANLYEYGLALVMYVQAGLYYPLALATPKSEQEAMQSKLPGLADQQILRHHYPVAIRTYLRARNAYEALREGITPSVDSLLAHVKKEPGYSTYEPFIAKQYAEWQKLLPGQLAPNFSGITPKGDVLSLSDLKGKVVYVDVWATWCGPCRAEFPQAKQLQIRFADHPQVAFLYVSVDQDKAAWQKLLASDTDFKGLHINLPRGPHYDSLWKAYKLSSIPRYLLIDQAGKLVDVNAAHPSSGKVAVAIERLLH